LGQSPKSQSTHSPRIHSKPPHQTNLAPNRLPRTQPNRTSMEHTQNHHSQHTLPNNNRLQKSSKKTSKQKKFNQNVQIHKSLTIDIKTFIHKKEEVRLELFKKTRLAGSNCLSMSVIAVMLARRKGVQVQVAIPRKISRSFHALVIYPESGVLKSIPVAGKVIDQNPRIPSAKEIHYRLKLASPFVTLVNLWRSKFKPKHK